MPLRLRYSCENRDSRTVPLPGHRVAELFPFLSAVQYPVDAVRGQISTGIDIVVHLSRLRDGARRILDISELLGFDGGKPVLNRLFRFRPEAGTKGMLEPTDNRIIHREKLEMRGFHLE